MIIICLIIGVFELEYINFIKVGAILFTKDVTGLIITPIELILKKLRRIA